MESDLFISNYALLMERFPKLGLQIPAVGSSSFREETLSFTPPEHGELLYFYGLGSAEGYFYLRKWLSENSSRRLIFLEEDLDVLGAFLHKKEAEHVLQDLQVSIFQPSDVEILANEFPLAHIEAYSLPSKKGRKFQALRLKLLRKTALSHALHLDRLYGDQPFTNFVANLTHLPRSFYANRLQNSFQGVPAIVCGAGPSLKAAIPTLKTLEKKAMIIAGGSTLAALSSQGVLPHFGMAVDPNLDEYHRLRNSFAFEMPLLYSTRVFPEIFQTCNGPFGYMRAGIGGMPELWMEEALALTEPLLGKHLNAETISVTAVCLAWAEFLGCNPIFLAGMDLAYTGGCRYAPGVDARDVDDLYEKTRAADRIVKRKDRHGRPIYTAVRWLMESASFSHFAKKHPKTTFLNTTEGGIGFRKIPFYPLQDAVERYLTKEYPLREKIHEAILQAPMPPHSEGIIASKMMELRESLERIIGHLEVLAEKRKGSKVLAEVELVEEMAYSYLFYDTKQILSRELSLTGDGEKWNQFLSLAQRYMRVVKS